MFASFQLRQARRNYLNFFKRAILLISFERFIFCDVSLESARMRLSTVMPRSNQLGTRKNTNSNHKVSDFQVGTSELQKETGVTELDFFPRVPSFEHSEVGSPRFPRSQLFRTRHYSHVYTIHTVNHWLLIKVSPRVIHFVHVMMGGISPPN